MNVSAISTSAATTAADAADNLSTEAKLRNAKSPEAQRKQVSQQFEAILVRQLLSKSVGSMLGGESGDVSGSVYGDMMTDVLAQKLTAGSGFGFSRLLEKQLTPKGEILAEGATPVPVTQGVAAAPYAAAAAAAKR
jgi:Rod binding domain-containing protein